MKLTCNSIDLSDALTKVGKALPIKRTNPILSGIKIKADGSILTLTASDTELTIEKKIVADIKIEGESVVEGRYFIDYVKKIEGEEINIDTSEKDTLRLTYGENNGIVQTMPADEYPLQKIIDEENFFFIQKNEFKDLINKIIFCAASEDNRPILKGCCLELMNNKIIGVASDSYRMAYCTKSIEYGGENVKIVVPARSLMEISKILDDEKDLIKISFEEKYFMIDLEHTKITTRLIEGNFIDYNKIIPNEFSTDVTVDKKMLETAIDRAALATRADKRSVIKLDIKENKMSISAESETRSINENININLEGKDLTIGFNARFISECLRPIEDSFVKMSFNASTTPGIILPTSGQDYIYLILPIRIIG
ncbi:MAG: DNA polymerase III subunit beta [Clostridia bacterium]